MIHAVVFDVGYTIIDERRQWASWAHEMGVAQDAFMGALKDVIAEGRHHREVFARLRPDFDWKTALARRDASAQDIWTEQDLYADARPVLANLKACGFQIGLAGNQPPLAKWALERLAMPVDWIANSAELGLEKPSKEFFDSVIRRCGVSAGQIAYVGDRLDNDVIPAQAAGMRGVFMIRGPWGEIHARSPQAAMADRTILNLDQLDAALA